MLDKKSRKKFLLQDPYKVTYGLIIISLILVVSISIISYNIGKKQGQEEGRQEVKTVYVNRNTSPLVKGEKLEAWGGIIKKIEQNKIVFVYTYSENGEVIEKELTALISAQTELYAWDLTKPPSIYTDNNQKKTITLTSFKEGDQITVQSQEGINENQEIKAEVVNLLITPRSQ